MPIQISSKGITEAIQGLTLRPGTLKAKFIEAVYAYYLNEDSYPTDPIPTEILIARIWEIDSAEEIRAKRKNFSSTKSSLNKSLKELDKDGKNPEGITIGKDNLFTISDEKKDSLIKQIDVSSEATRSLLEMVSSFKKLFAEITEKQDNSAVKKLIKELENTQSVVQNLVDILPDDLGQTPSYPDGEEKETIHLRPTPGASVDGTAQGNIEDSEAGKTGGIDDIKSGPENPEKFLSSDASQHDAAAKVGDDDGIETIGAESEIGKPEAGVETPAGADELEETEFEEEEILEVDDETLARIQDIVADTDGIGPDNVGGFGAAGGDEGSGAAGGSAPGDTGHGFGAETEPGSGIPDAEETQRALDWLADEDVEIIEADDEILDETLDTPVEAIAEESVSLADEGTAGETTSTPSVTEGPDGSSLTDDIQEDYEEEIIEVDDETLEKIQDIVAEADGIGPDDAERLSADDGGEGPGAAGESSEESAGPGFWAGTEHDSGVTDTGETQGLPDWMAEEDMEIIKAEDEILDEALKELTEEFEEIEEVEVAETGSAELEATEANGFEEILESEEIEDVSTDAMEESLAEDIETEDLEEVDEEEILEVDQETLEEIKRIKAALGSATGVAADGESADKPRLLEVLSEYMNPQEALADTPKTLNESHEEYIAQIMERFTPKFITIPEGRYSIGSKHPKANEQPKKTVLLKSFHLGQFPITNDLFELFVRDTGYETDAEQAGYGVVVEGKCRDTIDPESGRQLFTMTRSAMAQSMNGANWRHPDGPGSSIENRHNHPVVQVSRRDAMSFAAWAGKRLPTEEEWETGARGNDDRLFPWGNMWGADNGNFEGACHSGTTAVDHYGKKSASPFGIYDLLGNVFEWTSGEYRQDPASHIKPTAAVYILKGGSWATAGPVTIAARLLERGAYWSNTIGFRCAVSDRERS
ncbi:MAG: formylglycine-generating enzyme family protein [Proteobacteria bacterium]|nr:formylglycine-generating enzyme family protein [Pseudomonadota bacterium]